METDNFSEIILPGVTYNRCDLSRAKDETARRLSYVCMRRAMGKAGYRSMRVVSEGRSLMTRNLLAASCLIAGIAAFGIPASAAGGTLPTIIPGQWHGPPLGHPAPGRNSKAYRRRRYHRQYRPAPPIREYPLHGGRVLPGTEHRIPRVPPSPGHHIPLVLPR